MAKLTVFSYGRCILILSSEDATCHLTTKLYVFHTSITHSGTDDTFLELEGWLADNKIPTSIRIVLSRLFEKTAAPSQPALRGPQHHQVFRAVLELSCKLRISNHRRSSATPGSGWLAAFFVCFLGFLESYQSYHTLYM